MATPSTGTTHSHETATEAGLPSFERRFQRFSAAKPAYEWVRQSKQHVSGFVITFPLMTATCLLTCWLYDMRRWYRKHLWS
jgi:hypothetical protein